MLQPVLSLADALFGRADAERVPLASWLYYAATAILLAQIIALRQPDSIIAPQFFGEDALVYFPQNLALGFWPALAGLYQGFPYLLQRIIAWVGGLAAVTDAPAVYAYCGIALTALTLPMFVLPRFRHLVRSDALRLLLPIAVVSFPTAQERLLATAVNVGWYLSVWLTLVSLMPLPRRPWRLALLIVAAAATALSTPLVVMNIPLWILRLVRSIVRRDLREYAFALCLLVTAAVALAVTQRLGARDALPVPVTLEGFAVHIVHRIAALLVTLETYEGLSSGPPAPLFLLALAFMVVVLLLSVADRGRHRPGIALALLLALGAVWVTLLGRSALNAMSPFVTPQRFAIYPNAMLTLAVLMALDGLTRPWRWAATAAALAVFASARSTTFFIPPLRDLDWAEAGPRVERMLATGCPLTLRVPVNPTHAPLEIAWGTMYPDTRPLPNWVMGELAGSTVLTWDVTTHCEGLSAIELNLANQSPTAGAARLDLFAPGESEPVASATLDGSEIHTGWNTFCLPPLSDSDGVTFRLRLSAPGWTPAAPLLVRGAGGVVSLRYGCLDRAEPTLPFYDQQVRNTAVGGP